MISALFVALAASKSDPALTTRGDRKVVVTEVYRDKEEVAKTPTWGHLSSSGKCPVLLMSDTEVAVFTQTAKQTRHCHMVATEIYMLLEGKMTIEVEEVDYILSSGDMIIVKPGAYHEVKREGEFLCRVIAINCLGQRDRHDA